MGYNDRCNFSDLVGKTIISHAETSDEIRFACEDGSVFKMYHSQDCCESVSVEDITGDIKDLYGSPILAATEDSNSKEHPAGKEAPEYCESFTYTFYTLRNINATVQIRWFGESNGFYSESVDFEKVSGPVAVH